MLPLWHIGCYCHLSLVLSVKSQKPIFLESLAHLLIVTKLFLPGLRVCTNTIFLCGTYIFYTICE